MKMALPAVLSGLESLRKRGRTAMFLLTFASLALLFLYLRYVLFGVNIATKAIRKDSQWPEAEGRSLEVTF